MIELSIVIPAYNSELTIEQCIKSIGYSRKVEIIVIDDGSSDRTKEICEKYFEKCNFVYKYQENQGPGAARNKGISIARGKYIMFLDSDDLLNTEVLKNIIERELIKNYDIIYYSFEQINKDGELIKKHNLSLFHGCSKDELINYTLSWKLPWGQFKIIKSEILKTNNIKFDSNVINSEELVFTLECIRKSKDFHFIEETLYRYLKRSDSISNNINWENLNNDRINVIEQLNLHYGKLYAVGINNYEIISNIQILKFLSEQLLGIEGLKIYNNNFKKVTKYLLDRIDTEFMENRYKYICLLMKFKCDILLFFIFKILYKLRKR